MNTFLNITLVISVILLVYLYYFRIFKQLFKTPKTVMIYLILWLVIIFFSSLVMEKIYLVNEEKPEESLEQDNILEV